MEEMTLLVAFTDPSPSFVHGWEAGQIWHRLFALAEDEIDIGFGEGVPAHVENLDVLQRMASATGYSLEIGEAHEGWVPVRFTRQARSRPTLKVVPNG